MKDFFKKIKEGKSEWGNRFGFVLLPTSLRKNVCDPLEYVHQAKTILDRKKQSLEAHFAYYGGALIMSILGPKVINNVEIRPNMFYISSLIFKSYYHHFYHSYLFLSWFLTFMGLTFSGCNITEL